MIRVMVAPQPEDFEERVAVPGRRALLELLGDASAPTRRGPKRKRSYANADEIPVSELEKTHYWTEALPELQRRYRSTCAYLAMKIHAATGAATVDHFTPKSKDKWKAYEWKNFRLCARLVNAFKAEHDDVLDPFEIENGWFVLDVGTFEVKPNPEIFDDRLSARIRQTIERLHLNEPTFCEARRQYHDRYHGLRTEPNDPHEPWPLSWLESECPFVAVELRRQRRLRPEDV